MAESKSSTKTAAARGSTQTGGLVALLIKTEREPSATQKHDGCDQISCNLHSLLVCLIAIGDSDVENEPLTTDEREIAKGWLEWEAFKMSRDLRKAFA